MTLFVLSKDKQIEMLNDLHYNKNLSVADIAELNNTYTNKVRRLAKKLGVKLRDKSEAQKVALTTGKSTHPTKGTTRPDSVKLAIGKKIETYWSNLTPEELEERVQISKENWEKLTDLEKDNMLNLATKARLKTSKDGSKLEKAILTKLVEAGYQVDFHKEKSLLNDKLQLDLFLPKLNVAIEIDGPTHDVNIWGEDYLRKTQQRDFQKDGLVLNSGCVMIRVKQNKDMSLVLVENLSVQLFKILEDIKKKYPPVGQRKFIIE